MTGRILHAADFERLLAAPAVCRSTHFSLHHVASTPTLHRRGCIEPVQPELSTADPSGCTQPVDEFPHSALASGRWLGLAVPKRQVREAATRNLIKRQAREAFRRQRHQLRPGLWLLRVRRGFDRRLYRSATSSVLRLAARAELDALLQRAAR
jgi:ribonuclease P protein component